jgi:monoamine oxidase
MSVCDVVVVGAGFSGLMAARCLVAGGLSVRVLEARDRVGGRTLTRQVEGEAIDIGGQWIGPAQHRMHALCKELHIGLFPTFDRGRKILDVAGKQSTYEGAIPSLPLLHLLELQWSMMRIDRMTAKVPVQDPWFVRGAAEMDALTVEAWKQRSVRSQQVREVFDAAMRVVFGAEPSEMSLLHFLFYLRSGGGLKQLVEVKGAAQQDRLVQGAQVLASRMADALGDRVILSAPVRAIEQSGEFVTVTATTGVYRARTVIVAIPPALAGKIHYDPPLPAARDQLTQRIPMGATIKCVALYERPFWRDTGFSGEVVTSRDPFSVVYDNSPHGEAHGALVGFVVGHAARRMSTFSEADRRRQALDGWARYFGPRAARPVAYVEKDWAADPWSGGCPAGVPMPGILTVCGEALRAPVQRIHWAGTETAYEWNGYMEGALEAGERAASEVMVRGS